MRSNPERETQELTPSDERLKRLVHTIITDFDGDTTAFFDSIRSQGQTQPTEQDDKCMARRLVKARH